MFIPCVYLIEVILKFQWALDSPEVHIRITDPPHLYPPSRKFCLEMIRPRDSYCLKDSALTILPEKLHCGFSWFPLQHLPLTNESVSLGPEQTEKDKTKQQILKSSLFLTYCLLQLPWGKLRPEKTSDLLKFSKLVANLRREHISHLLIISSTTSHFSSLKYFLRQ